MHIDIITLFPQMFKGPFQESIIKRAVQKKLVSIKLHNLRDWAEDKRGTVDDRPFGGGAGMILKPEPLFRAVEDVKRKIKVQSSKIKVILLTPQGQVFDQNKAHKLSKLKNLILICGHYEGVDERVRKHVIDEEISIGDYVLTGGEIPAMVIADAIVRIIPDVLKKEEAITDESFQANLLEYPQYTRPEIFKRFKVPKILLSGDHKRIDSWRKKKALERTKKRRPDLLK